MAMVQQRMSSVNLAQLYKAVTLQVLIAVYLNSHAYQAYFGLYPAIIKLI